MPTNPNMSQSSSNTTLNQSGMNSSMMEDETIYVLPKTYNGKTVTELFPEFKYDSVSFLSKIIYPITNKILMYKNRFCAFLNFSAWVEPQVCPRYGKAREKERKLGPIR